MAVASELKKINPDVSVVFIGAKGSPLVDVPANDPNIDTLYVVNAGKFRRYHGEGLSQLLDIHTQSLNVRDLFKTINGLWQSWRLLGKIKPSVVFTRGGFISVPVAVAAWIRGIPYVTHDSDSTPSLANRIIASMASKHAVALDPSMYPYPLDRTVRVGIPISSSYHEVNEKELEGYRKELGLSGYKKMLFITGGGNGARVLNNIVKDNVGYLLKRYPDLVVVHVAGRKLDEKLSEEYDKILKKSDRKRVVVKDFVDDLYRYSGSADVIIARGGATNLAEFAAQKKPCIIIPSKQLIWNIKNAESLAKQQAIVMLHEDQAEQELRLASEVCRLLDSKKAREDLSKKIAHFYVQNAARRIAEILFELAN